MNNYICLIDKFNNITKDKKYKLIHREDDKFVITDDIKMKRYFNKK